MTVMENLQIVDKQIVLNKEFTIYGTLESPLFLAKDVAEWIDYTKTSKGAFDVSHMLKNVDDDEKLVRTAFVSGQNREYAFVTENGLYEILMLSKKPIAKQFKSEVKKLLHELRLKKAASSTPAEDTTLKEAFLMMSKAFNTLAEVQKSQEQRLSTIENRIEERKALLPPPSITPRNHIQRLIELYTRKNGLGYKEVRGMLYHEYDLRYHTKISRVAKSKGMSVIDYVESIGEVEDLESVALEVLA